MNYRHAFHAGGFADVLKHAVLALVIEHLKRKDAPFFALDTHAGRGRYDLAADAAQRTGEHQGGIARIIDDPAAPAALAPYLAAVRALQPPEAPPGPPRWYPGSPRLARALMRPGDRLFAVELHPEDAAALEAEFAGERGVRCYALDGFSALRAFLPPKERRGLVLVDPAFEAPDEFRRIERALAEGLRRWATGCFLLWYPVKHVGDVAAFRRRLAEAAGERALLDVRLRIRAADGDRLAGCGIAVANPPHGLAAEVEALLPYLVERLGVDAGAGGETVWLVPPR